MKSKGGYPQTSLSVAYLNCPMIQWTIPRKLECRLLFVLVYCLISLQHGICLGGEVGCIAEPRKYALLSIEEEGVRSCNAELPLGNPQCLPHSCLSPLCRHHRLPPSSSSSPPRPPTGRNETRLTPHVAGKITIV